MSTLTEKITLIRMRAKKTPKSWSKAAGLAKTKKKSLQTHASKVRKEWGK